MRVKVQSCNDNSLRKKCHLLVLMCNRCGVLSTYTQLAQPARLLLEYTGTKYEDKFYVCGEGNSSA